MNYDERIKQCCADIQAIEAEKKRLIVKQEAAKVVQWKHGDTANSDGKSSRDAERVFIQVKGTLLIFSMCRGECFHLGGETAQQWAESFHYAKTGNIFTDKK